MSYNDSHKNVGTISECLLIFGELSSCKELLSKIFGFQLFLIFCVDFVRISIFLYLLSYAISTSLSSKRVTQIIGPIISDLIVYIIPHVIRQLLLVHEMEQLGEKVSKYLVFVILN